MALTQTHDQAAANSIEVKNGSVPFVRISVEADRLVIEQLQGKMYSASLNFANWDEAVRFFGGIAYAFQDIGSKSAAFASSLNTLLTGEDDRIRDPRYWLAPPGTRLNSDHESNWRELSELYGTIPDFDGEIIFGEKGLIEIEDSNIKFVTDGKSWLPEELIYIATRTLGHSRNDGHLSRGDFFSPFLAAALLGTADFIGPSSIASTTRSIPEVQEQNPAASPDPKLMKLALPALEYYEDIRARGMAIIKSHDL